MPAGTAGVITQKIMSEQSDALNKIAREKGIAVDGPAPALPGLENDADRPDLPQVKLPRAGRQLRQFAREIGAIVGANGLFRRETTPVTIDPESGRIEDMNAQRLRTYVEDQLVTFEEQYTKKTGLTIIPETMGVDEARGVLECDAFRYPLRKLQRVNFVRLPVMRADGRIELLPKGYDPESGILTKKDCLDYATDWDAERAVLFLKDFFGEFPTVNERALAAHVCAMVAIYGAALMPVGAKRLNFAYRANRPRSGKGLMLQSALVGPCGPFIQIQALADSKEEFRKLLDTEALNGSSYIVFDEVENRLKNRTLNAFLTATIWTGRLMNSQKKFAVPQSSIVFIAGNNIDLSADLAGRFLLVDLYVAEADPQSRPIKHVIDEVYLARDEVRADLLSAMWALVSAWDKAKRTEPDSVYRGFESFSKIYGGIVQNAGFGNPMQSTAAEVDPDYADMLAIVERLAEAVERRAEYEFHQLIDVCRELHAFEWHLEGKMVKCKKAVPTIDADGNEDHEDTVEVDSERFELTPSKKSWFGKLFGDQYGGTKFTLSDGRRVQFGRRGSNRQRRFTIEVLGSDDQAETPIDAESN
jgi:hypothetical protein